MIIPLWRGRHLKDFLSLLWLLLHNTLKWLGLKILLGFLNLLRDLVLRQLLVMWILRLLMMILSLAWLLRYFVVLDLLIWVTTSGLSLSRWNLTKLWMLQVHTCSLCIPKRWNHIICLRTLRTGWPKYIKYLLVLPNLGSVRTSLAVRGLPEWRTWMHVVMVNHFTVKINNFTLLPWILPMVFLGQVYHFLVVGRNNK